MQIKYTHVQITQHTSICGNIHVHDQITNNNENDNHLVHEFQHESMEF